MRWLALMATLVVLLAPRSAAAHPLAPLVLELTAPDDGIVNARFKEPRVRPRGSRPAPSFPRSCRALEPARIEESADARIVHHRLQCDQLVGATFGVDGLGGQNAILRVVGPDGLHHQALLDAARPRFTVPAAPATLEQLREHGVLGLRHLAAGLDHLLFILGVWLLLRQPRPVVIALTAFTVGHSLTLSAAVLGWVTPPSAWIEVGIAASLVVVALELVRHAGKEERPPPRRAALVAGIFGLLHGFGFAGVLTEAGLPASEVPLALLGFNLGIELGQIALVATAFLVARLFRLAPAGRLRLVAGYAIGGLAAMWIVERGTLLLG